MAYAKLKVDPSKLPIPPLPPTLPCRVDPPSGLGYEQYTQDEKDCRTAALRLTRDDRKKHGFGKQWTYEEESAMLDLLQNGNTVEETARILGRTVQAIKGRQAHIRTSGRICE